MIELILSKENIETAYNHVVRKKGSAGVDRMSVTDLLGELQRSWKEIRLKLATGSYIPKPILAVRIPKTNGKTRQLGIPTVQDRMIQQAVAQVLSEKFHHVVPPTRNI